jgi:hypothetical protein
VPNKSDNRSRVSGPRSRQVRCYFAGGEDQQRRDEIASSLAANGIQLVPATETTASILPAVVFASEWQDDLLSFVSKLTQFGLNRVLMVAGTDERSLAGVWRLLDAGAADVLNVRSPVEAAEDVRARVERWDEIDDIVSSPVVRDNLIGQSPV